MSAAKIKHENIYTTLNISMTKNRIFQILSILTKETDGIIFSKLIL
jgi:hypothetical protein